MLAREQSVATFLTLEHMLRLAIAMASSSQPTDIDTFTSTPYSILLRHVAIKMFIANCRNKISFLSIFILLRHVAIKPCDSSQYFLFEDFSYSRTYANYFMTYPFWNTWNESILQEEENVLKHF